LQPDEVTKLQTYRPKISLIELIRLTIKGQVKKVSDLPCSLSQQRKTVFDNMNDDRNDDGNYSPSFYLLLLDLSCNKFELAEINVPHRETHVTVNSILNCIPFHSTSSLGKAKYCGLVDLKRVEVKTNVEETLMLKMRDIFVPIPIGNNIDECLHASNFIMNCPEAMLKLGGFIPDTCTSYPLHEVIKAGNIDWNKLLSITEDETYASSCDESFSGNDSDTPCYIGLQNNEKYITIDSVNNVKGDKSEIGSNLKRYDSGNKLSWGSLLI